MPKGWNVPNLCAKSISANLRLNLASPFCQSTTIEMWSEQCPGRWKCFPIWLFRPSLASRRCSSARAAKGRYVSPTYIHSVASLQSKQMTAYTTSTDWQVKRRRTVKLPLGPLMTVADETCRHTLHLGRPQGWVPGVVSFADEERRREWTKISPRLVSLL